VIVVVTGPAGAGKTTVGRALAAALGWPFLDADDFHPPENVQRMTAGLPLTDEHRAPWLQALAGLVAAHAAAGSSVVLACSALRREHRRLLLPAEAAEAVRFVYLRATPALLASRLSGREGHFFGAGLLASQLAALEEPNDDDPAPVLTLDASAPVDELVARTRLALGL
jgi:gluconokinase